MHHATLLAFIDEMNSISMEKQAGFMRDAAVPWVGRHSRGIASNLVGTAKAFTNPAQGVRQGWKATMDSFRPDPQGSRLQNLGRRANAGLMAVGAVGALPGVLKKEDPTGRGRSRIERGAGFVGNQLGGIIGAPFGLSGGLAGSIGGDMIGRQVGRVVDKVRGYKPQPRVVQPVVQG